MYGWWLGIRHLLRCVNNPVRERRWCCFNGRDNFRFLLLRMAGVDRGGDGFFSDDGFNGDRINAARVVAGGVASGVSGRCLMVSVAHGFICDRDGGVDGSRRFNRCQRLLLC